MKAGDVVKIKNNVDCLTPLKNKYHIVEGEFGEDVMIQGILFKNYELELIAEQSKLIEEIIPTHSISLEVYVISKAEVTEIGNRIRKAIFKELDSPPYIAFPNDVSIIINYPQ